MFDLESHTRTHSHELEYTISLKVTVDHESKYSFLHMMTIDQRSISEYIT